MNDRYQVGKFQTTYSRVAEIARQRAPVPCLLSPGCDVYDPEPTRNRLPLELE
jgi:hypothetical protein